MTSDNCHGSSLKHMNIPRDINESVKTNQYLKKYKNLDIEIGRIQNLMTAIITLVIGVLGMIVKEGDLYIAQTPRSSRNQSSRHQDILLTGTAQSSGNQKTLLVGTAHILRKIFSM